MKYLPLPKFLLLLFCCLCSNVAAESIDTSPRVRECFDADWLFVKRDAKGADAKNYDHSTWKKLDLPHDWSIEGPFDQKHASQAQGGYLPCGIGWYRKVFKTPSHASGKKVFIEFDGIYMNGEVWINGHRLGKRPYGYTGVQYDLTPHLDAEGENIIAVRVDNSLQPSTRWYTGSGIYRHVWLTVTDKLHVGHWGTQISTPEITPELGKVAISTTIHNEYGQETSIDVVQAVIDANGKQVATQSGTLEISAGGKKTIAQQLSVTKPLLWSPDSPNMYTVVTELRDGDNVLDKYTSPLGFRTIVIDAKRGLFVNGQNM
ncbi:MAG: sugar-binding domain-containing protein, partial [Akkermansiaceae bacterium]